MDNDRNRVLVGYSENGNRNRRSSGGEGVATISDRRKGVFPVRIGERDTVAFVCLRGPAITREGRLTAHGRINEQKDLVRPERFNRQSID